MLDFNLEYYRAFYYVAQLGSITRAANALFLGQPTLTRSIHLLEESLDCQLFIRTAKGMTLTKEGETLYQHVTLAFEELVRGQQELQRLLSFQTGTLDIAVTETALQFVLLPVIEKFIKKYPNIDLHITGSSTPESIDLLRHDKADFALTGSPILDASGLVVTPIKQFHDIIVAGEAFRKFFAGNLISITELLDQPLATVEKGTSAFSNTERWFQEQGSPLVPHFSVRAFSTVFQLVKSHLAIGILPDMYVENELQSGEFFQIETEQKPPSREIVLIYKSEKNLSFLSKQFIEFLKGNEL